MRVFWLVFSCCGPQYPPPLPTPPTGPKRVGEGVGVRVLSAPPPPPVHTPTHAAHKRSVVVSRCRYRSPGCAAVVIPESAQGPSLPPPEGAPRGRTVLCCEGQAPSPVVHPGHPASPALSLPRVRAPAAPPYPPRVLVAVPMCEGTSSGLRLDAGDAACGGP